MLGRFPLLAVKKTFDMTRRKGILLFMSNNGVRCDEEGFTPPNHAKNGVRRDGEGLTPPGHVENGVRRDGEGLTPPGHVEFDVRRVLPLLVSPLCLKKLFVVSNQHNRI